MKVMPLQERGRYHVESDSGEEPYLVDLLEYRRNGMCGCRDFEIHIMSKWESYEVPARKYCKHIRKVRNYLADLIASLVEGLSEDQIFTQVDRIIFRWARDEVHARLKPQRYGMA
jgi:hypothetical protein